MNTLIPTVTKTAPPKLLLADTNRWALSARLAMGLAEAGCQVSAICPTPGHALMKSRAVQRVFRYSGVRPLDSLTEAIGAVDPDFIVPSCDRSVEHLHELYARAKSYRDAGSKIVALIERSLGPAASHRIVSSRFDLLALAREEGIQVPDTGRIRTPEDLDSWRARGSFPWVLKADGTWGGGGVRIVQSLVQAEQAFTALARTVQPTRAIKRLLVNRDPFWLRPWWNQTRREVIIQSYIGGRPANCAVVCWKGRVLAAIGVEVVRSDGLTGPASVVRVVDNVEMMAAARKIASRLGLSGFFGLDFVIEKGSDVAYLIEMNPRTTPPCHLRLGGGRDLAGALHAELTGVPLVEVPPVTKGNMIAYFPQAPNVDLDMAEDYFQDIPQGEPELVQELLHPFPDRTFLYRVIHRLTRKSVHNETSVTPANPPHGLLGDPGTVHDDGHETAGDTAIDSRLSSARVKSI